MVDYIAARDAIASIIGAVSITDPISASIDGRVAVHNDGRTVEEMPAVVIVGYEARYLRPAGHTRKRIYTVGLRLVVREADDAAATPMHEVLDAFKEAIGAAFDSKITLGLGGGYHVIEGPNWIQREPVSDGGALWDEGEIIIELGDARTFSA